MQSFNNNTTSLLDPNEGTLRKLYFENNSPQIPKSPDASTLYSSNDGGGAGLGLTRSSFNTSLRSQRLEQSVRSITEQQVPVLRQKRQEPAAKMSEIEPEYFDGRVSTSKQKQITQPIRLAAKDALLCNLPYFRH